MVKLDQNNNKNRNDNHNMFSLKSNFTPAGDQPSAIKELISGIKNKEKDQVLLGVTGSGKTFTMAHVINSLNRPSLLMAPNKTLAAQLYGEMKDFFPDNAVEYFVSYYDYYQPEAYVPRSDTFIEKESEQLYDAKENQFLADRFVEEKRCYYSCICFMYLWNRIC